MTENIKPSVEQDDAVRKQPKVASDKKTASKSEVFYASVAYLQFEDSTKELDTLQKRGHWNKLLNAAAQYDHGDAIGLDQTYKSPLQNRGDSLLKEDKNYAVVYNNSVGGTYEVFRKVTPQEVLMNVERYGLSDNATKDVKSLVQSAEKESAAQKQGQSAKKEDSGNAKELRDDFAKKIVDVAGKNNHHVFVLPLADNAIKVENSKGKEVQIDCMQVLRGRVTFTDNDGNKLQLRELASESIRHLGEVIPPVAKEHANRQHSESVAPKRTQEETATASVSATSAQQQKFIEGIKSAMNGSKMVVLPDFGTKKGVVAGTDEDKGISLNRVYAWNDNVSFAGSVPGDDAKKRRYYHPENIRPEFYDYLVSEVKKAVAPQLVTENGQKVTSANLFESPKQEGKYFFYARLDGVGLHPKAVKEQDVDAFMRQEMSVKDMFAKYYPTKMAKQLGKEEFDSLKLSDGRELSTFRVYKQRNEAKPHFGEYMLYAEMGDKRFHATPLTHDQLDAYFDRTQSKSQIAEKVIGEQLHLKSAYEKYKLPENGSVQEVRVRKTPDGDWVISASMGEKGQTPERKMSNNDLYSLFKSKTATREQLAAKYLTEDIRELTHSRQQNRTQGLKI